LLAGLLALVVSGVALLWLSAATATAAAPSIVGPAARTGVPATDDGAPRRFEGAILLSTPALAGAEPFITANRVVFTLPPAGEAGSAEGQFEVGIEIPGPVMYVNIAALAEAVGEAIGEQVSAASGVTLDQVERSGIEVPPEFDDCLFATALSGQLTGSGGEAFSGDGTVATVITGSGCEDTAASVGSSGQTTTQPASWSATVEGERMTGTITITDEDGATSELAFEASADGGAVGGTLACPTIAGYEVLFGGGRTLDAGSGDYQRAFVCDYGNGADGALHVSARWDWAEAPAGAEPTSCGLPPALTDRGGGTRDGYTYSQGRAALVGWEETGPTEFTVAELDALVAPLLPAAEALAVACPAAGGGAVVTPAGATSSEDGGDLGGGSDGWNPFTDLLLGEGEIDFSRGEAAAAAGVAAGIVALTSLIHVLAAGSSAAGGSGFATATPASDAGSTSEDGTAGEELDLGDAILEVLEDLPLGGQRPPETIPTGFGTAAELFDTDADGEFDTAHIDVGVDGTIERVVRLPSEGAAPEEAAADAPTPVEESEGASLEDALLEQLEEAPPLGAREVIRVDADEDGRPDSVSFDTDDDGVADTIWVRGEGNVEVPEWMQEESRQISERMARAEAERTEATEAAAEAPMTGASTEEAAAATAAQPEDPAAMPPPADLAAADLARLIRSHPRAQVLEAEDLDALARFIEDPEVTQIEILPPIGRAVVKDVGVGILRADLSLTGVTNTETGVSFRLTGGITVPVGVQDGRVVLDLPESYRRFTGVADGYLEQINRAFAESGRRITSIRQNEDSFLEITAEQLGQDGGAGASG
jgi:hypothetical protein